MATVTPSPETSWLRACAVPAASFAALGGEKLPKEGSWKRVLCVQGLTLEIRERVPQARLVSTQVPGCWLGWASGQLAPDPSSAPPSHKMSGFCALTPPPTCPVCQLGQAAPLSLTTGHAHFMTWQNENSSTKNPAGQQQGAVWQDHPGALEMGGAKRAAFDGGQGLGNTLAGWNWQGQWGWDRCPG